MVKFVGIPQVNQAIKQLNMTRIIIAHRPQTIVNAERIMQLHKGQLRDVTKAYKAKFSVPKPASG
ncbi:hypothetical protein [Arsukibacterium perlucidum]|uniref:hypothetical protein n=1 Tax=Arsukibacterium perlucidum TaxID=368811 RepID=UPI00036ABA59|nr:hypothetical protein [Arsukibacterium perlucidum]